MGDSHDGRKCCAQGDQRFIWEGEIELYPYLLIEEQVSMIGKGNVWTLINPK